MNQSGRHNQLQRQPGQDRQAKTSGARTKPKGPDKARTRILGTRRVKPRVRPATPQTSGARAAKISASGCKTVKAGSKELLRLRIAPLPPQNYGIEHFRYCPSKQGPSTFAVVMVPTRFSCPPHLVATGPSLLRAKKKAGVVEHPKAYDHAGVLVNWPPDTGRVAL